MIPANIKVQIDEKALKQYIHEQLEQQIQHECLLVDVIKLAILLSMSQRFIEEEFLQDPRVRQFEVRKNKKRWYWYKETTEVIKQIIEDEWNK
ncbi:hypothetical protein [Ureibacillus sinduriensis]|uniref:Group-specific protein n=1 Tax=Ureibacillus sinduriensis BLB-1 = JCM 15800 TaxID=1384057 RepID=A0A0A3IS72_9BACL|nr:hypothetical protein [Ureibacillus sinduriensis]KGR77687.1 hypothetical protein CD33_02405 [Ureibacillus sinduriensis BLB-1 = JCM 15800]